MASLSKDGFEVVPSVLDHRTCSDLAVDLPVAAPGTRRLLEIPEFASLAVSLRSHPTLEMYLKDLAAVQGVLFQKSRRTNWSVQKHRDTVLPMGGLGPWKAAGRKEGQSYVHASMDLLRTCVVVRLSLDDVPEGDINVVSGSHTERGQAHVGDVTTAVVPKGGALLLRPCTIHSSTKLIRSTLRRVLHFLYGPPDLPFNYRWHHAL